LPRFGGPVDTERLPLKSALQNLLTSENENDVLAFFRSRGPRAHIVAPEWVRERVVAAGADADAEGLLASWSQSADEAPEGKSNFFVVTRDAMAEQVITNLLGAHKGARTYGLYHHVFPAILCGMNGTAAGLSVRHITRYALLCIPRSGSRYLAAVLSNRGIGAPKEHIREPLANIITEGKLGFAPAITALERFGQRNGIFGTKLISTFLIKASNRRMAEIEANVRWMVNRGYRFVHLERPLNETVVSSYIAFLMKKWHFFGELDEASRARLDNLVFESGAAWEEYLRFHAEQIVVSSLAAANGIPTIRYSEIESGIDEVVGRICSLIGVDQEKLEAGSARIPLATRFESPTYGRFAEQLEQVLHDERDELQPRLVRKLRAMTSLGVRQAERLIEETLARNTALV